MPEMTLKPDKIGGKRKKQKTIFKVQAKIQLLEILMRHNLKL
jgi:hypothetical protein